MQRSGRQDEAGEIDISGDGGLLKTITREGTGEPIASGMTAIVHYTGKLLDGNIFDSSVSRGRPFRFTVGGRQVIKGWDKGVLTMKKGEVCYLKCRSDYAYGSRGVGPIPADATLVFEVELLDWEEPGGSNGYASILVIAVAFFLFAFAAYKFHMKRTGHSY